MDTMYYAKTVIYKKVWCEIFWNHDGSQFIAIPKGDKEVPGLKMMYMEEGKIKWQEPNGVMSNINIATGEQLIKKP